MSPASPVSRNFKRAQTYVRDQVTKKPPIFFALGILFAFFLFFLPFFKGYVELPLPSPSLSSSSSSLSSLSQKASASLEYVFHQFSHPVPCAEAPPAVQLLGKNRSSNVYPPSFWARGTMLSQPTISELVWKAMNASTADLMALCGRCLYSSLTKAVRVREAGESTFVATGDINEMWIRDSTVQVGIYIPRIKKHPYLRLVIEGVLRRQAFYLIQDPYASAFHPDWRSIQQHPKMERLIGRGGYVAQRNYELDSPAYFFSLLYDYFVHAQVHDSHKLLEEPLIFDTVNLLVDTMIVEQNHDEKSKYRYSELPQNGKGSHSAYTGMTWTGFRPSDDKVTYHYNIPANMFAVSALLRVIQINDLVWKDSPFSAKAIKLVEDIRTGIEKFGVTEDLTYAYEVDGFGGVLKDFDDANIPSLLSIPILNYPYYNKTIYENTRARLLSPRNRFFFQGSQLTGVGSPHTPPNYIWPMSMAVQALTSADPQERVHQFLQMLKSQCGTGLMHESVHKDHPEQCTRPWFEWANAMLVIAVEDSLGVSCEEYADEHYRGERAKTSSGNNPDYFAVLESTISHE